MARAPVSDPIQVRGLSVGSASDPDRTTGVTVLRFGASARTAVDVRGGASATYDTASLGLEATFGGRWALFLAGGSLFGLDAARGIRDAVLASGGGHSAFGNSRPIAPVSGACLFDLPAGGAPLPDYAALGRTAYDAAERRVAVGPVGAGTGATVGKYLGRGHSAPGGQGFAQARVAGLGSVAVVLALNSVGAIRDPSTGRWVEGARRGGRIVPPRAGVRPPARRVATPRGTNLVAVVTDAAVDRAGLQRIAILAQTGLSQCVVPAATATDGDVTFASSTSPQAPARSRYPGEVGDTLGRLASELAVRAALTAVGR